MGSVDFGSVATIQRRKHLAEHKANSGTDRHIDHPIGPVRGRASPLTTTVAPQSAMRRAMASPIPPVEPVTIAILPDKSIA
jgi:hypothetical protein